MQNKIEIKIIKNITDIQYAWKKLESGRDMTYFQSYNWNFLLVKQFNKQIERRLYRKIRFICVFDEQDIVIIAPIRIKKLFKGNCWIKEIELLGADSFSDYTNLIYGDNLKEGYFDYLFDYFDKWKGFSLKWNSIYKATKFGCYVLRKYLSYTSSSQKSVFIPTNAYNCFEDYFSSLSKSTRQNYRTSCNRMLRDKLDFSFKLYGCLTNSLGALNKESVDHLMTLNLKRSIEKNPEIYKRKINIIKEKINLKYRSIVKDNMICNLDSWTLVAYLNDKAVGFLTGVMSKTKDCIYVMMNKVDPEFEFYSPMMTAIIKFIEYNYSIGYTGIYDFGRGTETYKYKLGGQENILISLNMTV